MADTSVGKGRLTRENIKIYLILVLHDTQAFNQRSKDSVKYLFMMAFDEAWAAKYKLLCSCFLLVGHYHHCCLDSEQL